MTTTLTKIKKLFATFSSQKISRIDTLQQSGSDRYYFRIFTAKKSYIATYGNNIKENESFMYLSTHFKNKNLAVPKVFCCNSEKDIYLQEDFGNVSLLNKLQEWGYVDSVYNLYKQSLHQLALLQINGHINLDYEKCLTNKYFGKQAIVADLLYFKYYFLDTLRQPYDKQKLLDDFDALSIYLAHTEYNFFMFRDFQSRNILVTPPLKKGAAEQVHFIDYQGGMLGAPQYDVASLLWQAKAHLPNEWKQNLLTDYINYFEKIIKKKVDKDVFIKQYNGYVLIRLLQVLGAYGFRGLFERKAHFLSSIPLALQNLKQFITTQSVGIAVPEFKKVLELCTSNKVIAQFTPVQATEQTALVVTINSFSYIKTGYPKDKTKNGGGFVFDMRGILNPGRFDDYKHLSGLDKPVKDFLEHQTKMPEFLNSVYSIIDIAVQDYITRNFESLMINFGCTGGQHRSVFAAEAVARHLKNKFNVKIILRHTNKKNWMVTNNIKH